MSFGKDSSLKFVMEGAELVNLARSDVTTDKQPLDSIEEEVWRIFSEYQQMKDFIEGTDNEEAYQQWITCNKP